MKSTVLILVMVMIAWMGVSEYVWLCLVKSHCGGSIAGLAANPASNPPPAAGDMGPSTGQGETGPGPGGTSDGVSTSDALSASPSGSSDLTGGGAAPGGATAVPGAEPGSGLSVNVAGTAGRAISLLAGTDSVLRLNSVPEFSSGQWQLPQTDDLVDPLVAWLNQHPRVDLVITGEFLASEFNASDWSDLGLARANELIDVLARSGVPKRRLVASSRVVALGAPGLDISAEDYAALFQPMRVYFPRNSKDIIVSDELREFATKADQYLDRHPAAYVRLIGHTDETGAVQANYTMGLYRAREVAALLMELGVPAARLEVDSAGEAEPDASNDSERGRALNRRVEIQLDSR